jgi:hypothetical protein
MLVQMVLEEQKSTRGFHAWKEFYETGTVG